MNIFAKRLNAALEKNNMRPTDLAEKTGIGKSAISQYMSGAFKPKQVRTEKIANALGVSVAYLMGWEDDCDNVAFRTMNDSECCSYPIIGEVAAGYGSEAIEEETGDYEQIPLEWLRGHNPENFFVLRVKGDSMYPDYQDGDLVLVHRQASVDSGAVGVVLYDDELATLKKIRYKNGENWVELIPRNPEYSTKRIENEDLEQCRVLGEARRLIRVVK